MMQPTADTRRGRVPTIMMQPTADTRRGRVPTIMLNPGGHAFFCTHDGNKNVSEVFFFQQAYGIAAHYEYAPFGAVTAVVTNNAITAFSVAEANPFRFSSEYADAALGLVYYNYRHYNPVDGRWVSRDFFTEEELSYSSCNNNLVDLYDVLGMVPAKKEKKCSTTTIGPYDVK